MGFEFLGFLKVNAGEFEVDQKLRCLLKNVLEEDSANLREPVRVNEELPRKLNVFSVSVRHEKLF